MVLTLGDNAWETIVANTPRYSGPADDLPIWERETDHLPDRDGTTPLGWLDRATWRSRAVRLLVDDDGLVRRCRIHQHLKLEDGSLHDPFVPVRIDKDGERKIVRLPSGKRLWRAADAVLEGLREQADSSVVMQAIATFERWDSDRHPQILVAGLQIDQAKVADAQHAQLPISRALLVDDDRRDLVHRALEEAEGASRALGAACAVYQQELGVEPDPRVYARWQQPYWASIGQAFPRLVADVAYAREAPRYSDPALVNWSREVRRRARAALAVVESQDAADPRQLAALARARRRFDSQLARNVPDPEEDA